MCGSDNELRELPLFAVWCGRVEWEGVDCGLEGGSESIKIEAALKREKEREGDQGNCGVVGVVSVCDGKRKKRSRSGVERCC